jgi:plasmid stability protein
MAVLTIRNLPEDVHAHLRVRAARHGRSMEAEVRAILREVCVGDRATLGPQELQAFVRGLYRNRLPRGVVDDLLRERRLEARAE